MGNTTDNNPLQGPKGFKKPRGFRMAYSLNNYQPVECTMISDQPFFYMNEEMVMEEDCILSDENFNELAGEFGTELSEENYDFLESEITKIKNKIDAYERVSLEFSKPEDQRHQEFIMDSHFIASVPVQMNEEETLKKAKASIAQSRMAQTMLEFAQAHDVKLVISDQIETVSYDKRANKILIRSDIDSTDQILLLVQELRRHWQHRQGALVHPLTFHPEQAVLINRAQLADLSTAVIRCAWEMKLNGASDIWARIENSSFSDLGRAFAREAISDFRTLNNGKASAAVFETWFLSERCRAQDKKLIQAMLADYRGYVFENCEASKMVSIDLVCALGEQPFGKNYLAPYAHMILNDPVFTDVRDRSNANFLWFIKFERSFSETEQELQSSGQNTTLGIDPALNNDITEDTNYENQYGRQAKDRAREYAFRDESAEQSGNNVIHVRFGLDRSSREGILS